MILQDLMNCLIKRYSYFYTALCGCLTLILAITQLLINFTNIIDSSIIKSTYNLLVIFIIGGHLFLGACIIIGSCYMVCLFFSLLIYNFVQTFLTLNQELSFNNAKILKITLITINVLTIIIMLVALIYYSHDYGLLNRRPDDYTNGSEFVILGGASLYIGLFVYGITLFIVFITEQIGGFKLPALITNSRLYITFASIFVTFFYTIPILAIIINIFN